MLTIFLCVFEGAVSNRQKKIRKKIHANFKVLYSEN